MTEDSDDDQGTPDPPTGQEFLPAPSGQPSRRTETNAEASFTETGDVVLRLTHQINELSPEIADRVVTMLEEQQDHNQEMERRRMALSERHLAMHERQVEVEADLAPDVAFVTRVGAVASPILALAVLGVVGLAIAKGSNLVALTSVLTAAAVFVGAGIFVYKSTRRGEGADESDASPNSGTGENA